MAYILVAVGALMAAAGLYVIGYGWIDARYEEYWNALGAGATLTAGGTITLALGFAVRALLQVKAAFVGQSNAIAVPTASEGFATEPTPTDPHGPLSELPGVDPLPVEPLAAFMIEGDPATTEPQKQLEFPIPPVAGGRHPLRPPPLRDTDAVVATVADLEPVPPPAPGSSPAVDAERDEKPAPHLGEPEHHDVDAAHDDPIPAARPADDYKLETLSTTEHDLTSYVKPTPDLSVSEDKPSVSLPRSNDWFDRALADIDEELPMLAPPTRSPNAANTMFPTPVEPADLELEPATVGSEAARIEAMQDQSSVLSPAAPMADPMVIGRYEAEGTSYVMYADGSIEAQSSAGVYRFTSMAELKAFIES